MKLNNIIRLLERARRSDGNKSSGKSILVIPYLVAEFLLPTRDTSTALNCWSLKYFSSH